VNPNLRGQLIRLRVLLIICVVTPIITAIIVLTNPSPDPLATGASLGILIRVCIGSAMMFGYCQYLARKYRRDRDLAEWQELLDMPAKVVK